MGRHTVDQECEVFWADFYKWKGQNMAEHIDPSNFLTYTFEKLKLVLS